MINLQEKYLYKLSYKLIMILLKLYRTLNFYPKNHSVFLIV